MKHFLFIFKVAPAELEDLLRLHPQVKDVAVIAVPHERYGEVPRAYIVKGDSDLKEDVIVEFLADKVAEYKRLRGGIEFIDQIPKSAAGKILRRHLKEKFDNDNKK